MPISSTTALPLDQPRRTKTKARWTVAVLFVLMRAADAALFAFAFKPLNPFPALCGLTIGAALASLALFIAIWHRQAWARYVQIVILWGLIGAFGLAGLTLANEPGVLVRANLPVLALLAGGTLLYLIVNTVLSRSRRIIRLVSAPCTMVRERGSARRS